MIERLAYVGRILCLDRIEDADFIQTCTVVCGSGGKWRGVVRICDFDIGDECVVFLPDAVVPQDDGYEFMRSTNWRVRMRRFKGAPSEVVIVPVPEKIRTLGLPVGCDVTEQCGVTRYFKPIPVCLAGCAAGDFPGFIPKTDELYYQRADANVDLLVGKSFYVTVKMDGSSTTAYKYKGHFGVCSRNWEIKPDESNGYWIVAKKYKLEEQLPEGIALQWETCGPGIQNNPMGIKEIDGYAFSAYRIIEKRYLTWREFEQLCISIKFPMCVMCDYGESFSRDGIHLKGEGTYDNGRQREGVVIRSQENLLGHKPVSFKVMNLGYEK